MSLTTGGHRLTFVINSTGVDDDTLRRIEEQVLEMLNDPDDLPSEVSTTTVFQAIPTTVVVTEVHTSVVTATVTVARTITVVPSTTFRPSQSRNGIQSSTSTKTLDSISTNSLPLTSTLSTSSLVSASNPSPLFSSTTSSFFSSTISVASSSNASTNPSSTASTNPPMTLLTDLPSNTSTPPVTKKRLPSGAIVGIVIACMIFFLLVIYFIRWHLKRKRKGRRNWITPFVAEKPVVRPSVNQRQEKRMEALAERWQRMRNLRKNRGAMNANNSSSNKASRQNRDGEDVFGPPIAYRGPSAGRAVQDALLVSSVFPNGAVAKLRFEPRKQDELRVRPGDYLKVLTLFDDGWTLCRNSNGGKGMVPTTCLRANGVGRMG